MFDYLKLIYFLLRPKTVFVRKRSGALGDDLLMSLVLPALKEKYPQHKIIIEARWKELFENNPNIDWVTDKHIKTTKRHLIPGYLIDRNTKESIYLQLMKSIGFNESACPRLFLAKDEIDDSRIRFNTPYIAICPSGKQKFSANIKEWGVENFQKLRDMFPEKIFVQIGLKNDVLLENVVDARGLKARQSAAILHNAVIFIGLEGGLMHLAKSVGRKSLIIYGGFIKPEISAYPENINISNLVECSPCFHSNRKHHDCESMKCMKEISPVSVAEKLKIYLSWKLSGRQA